MRMYRAWLNTRIDEYEVTRKTDKSIWYKVGPNSKPRCERINSDTHSWFSNREDAKRYLIHVAAVNVRKAKDSLEYFNYLLDKAKQL